jgi:hypothetical protein
MGDWTESKYHETRFGGMDRSVEPHTLDRDGGVMADEFNMLSRTQGLRVRRGWILSDDLALYVSSVPGRVKAPLSLIPYESNLVIVPADDPDDGSGGDGGNGGVVGGLTPTAAPSSGRGSGPGPEPEPEPEPEPDPDVTLALNAPATVVADVPFELSASATGGYNGANARLAWTFSPYRLASVSLSKGVRSGWAEGEWEAEATVRTADRSRTTLAAELSNGGLSEPAVATMAYVVPSMVPDLPATVPYRRDFTFTVSCEVGGSVQTDYAGNGRGVAFRWKAVRGEGAEEEELSCSVVVGGGSWSGGVGTYRARLSSIPATATKLRVVAVYAGESNGDDASVSGTGLLSAPASLHVYGEGAMLRINAVALDPSELSLVARVAGEPVALSDWLEMDDGEDIDLSDGWSDGVWEHAVRARSSASAATLSLRLVSGETELAEADVAISDAISATVSAASPVVEGDAVEASAAVSAAGFTLARLPEGTVLLNIYDENGQTVGEGGQNGYGETRVEAVSTTPVPGTYVVKALEAGSEEVLASTTVVVLTSAEAARKALAEAINERILAKTGEAGAYSMDDTLSTLWGGALAAMKNFANASGVAADGTYTAYADTAASTDIGDPSGQDALDWLEDAYAKVCTAKSMSAGYETDMAGYECSSSYTGEVRYDAEPPYEPVYVEDKASCQNKALARAAWEEDADSRGWKAYSGGSTAKLYDAWVASLTAHYSDNRIRCTIASPSVAVHADYYFTGSSSYGGTWNSLGHAIAQQGQTTKLFQNDCAAGGSFGWVDAGNDRPALTCEGGGGYEMSVAACIATYNFKHKRQGGAT